jgi:predicted transcriptional regulator
MSTAKEQVQEILNALPGEATLEDVMEQIYVRIKVEQGLKELDAGEFVSQEEVERELLSD